MHSEHANGHSYYKESQTNLLFTCSQGQLAGYQWFWMADSFLRAIPVHSFKRSVINHAIRTEHRLSAPSSLLGKDLFMSLSVVKLLKSWGTRALLLNWLLKGLIFYYPGWTRLTWCNFMIHDPCWCLVEPLIVCLSLELRGTMGGRCTKAETLALGSGWSFSNDSLLAAWLILLSYTCLAQ